ncbi:hypothetical protein K6V64_10750, partial [Streptococcus suis]|nr:hypothetical protein [Streptococcus suis]
MTETIPIQFLFRRRSASDWLRDNPVLKAGEVVVELDTHFLKVGDGATAYAELPYLTGPTGPRGERGEPGIPGRDGVMRFEELTEEQRNSLKGVPGEKGDTGPVGPQGLKG